MRQSGDETGQPAPAGLAQEFVDKAQVRRNFRRVAATYAASDFLAREVDGRMQERLDYVRLTPAWIADLGCGPGLSLPGLQARYPEARILGLDQEAAMLHWARRHSGWRRWLGARPRQQGVQAEAAALPLRRASIDLAWANLLLPWLDAPLPFFGEVHASLKVGGLFMFSSLGPDTLKELRGGFADGYAHTQRFADMHDLGDMLLEAGFADPVVDMEVLTLTYADVQGLLADLRAAGATCAMRDRRRGLAGRQLLKQLMSHYEALRNADGRLPATFEIIYGHAWKPAPRQLADGRAIIRFERR